MISCDLEMTEATVGPGSARGRALPALGQVKVSDPAIQAAANKGACRGPKSTEEVYFTLVGEDMHSKIFKWSGAPIDGQDPQKFENISGQISGITTAGPHLSAGTMDTAQDIYQRHLDLVTDMFWSRSFQAIVPHFTYPATISTPQETVVIPSPEAFVAGVQRRRESLDRAGVTSFQRRCDKAGFASAQRDVIDGYHTSILLRDGIMVEPNIRSRLRLVLQDGVWRLKELQTVSAAILAAYTPSKPLTSSDTPE